MRLKDRALAAIDVLAFAVVMGLLLLVTVTGCGRDKATTPEKEGNVAPATDLRTAHKGWLDALAVASDPATGWPSVEDCDGTLWAGMAAAAGAPVDVTQAEHAPGQVHRRPHSSGPCWTHEQGDVGSKSTVSQDMLTGYLWGVWARRDLEALERLAAYGEAHDVRVAKKLIGWIMGAPYPDRVGEVLARGNVFGLVGRMLFALSGGADDRSYRRERTTYLDVGPDWAQHVQVLGILLQGEVRNAAGEVGLVDIGAGELGRLRAAADEYPADALFQAALAVYTGDATRAEALLLDPAYECPGYVRGAQTYCLVHRAFAAAIVLKRNGGLGIAQD